MRMVFILEIGNIPVVKCMQEVFVIDDYLEYLLNPPSDITYLEGNLNTTMRSLSEQKETKIPTIVFASTQRTSRMTTRKQLN